MSRRTRPATAAVYVDIIPTELRARFNELESKHSALVLKGGDLSADDWAELAEIEDAQADLLLGLHRMFFEQDRLISDVMNRAHVVARREASDSRKNAALLGGDR